MAFCVEEDNRKFKKVVCKVSATQMIAGMLCFVFVAVLLYSAIFIYTHAHHIHDHDGPDGSCATCAQLIAVEALSKQINTVGVKPVLVLCSLLVILSLVKSASADAVFSTPVTLKIRLND